MEIEKRKATDSDYDFCEEVHHNGLRPYVEPLWGWEDKFQRERYKRLWKTERISILILNKDPIGYLELEEKDDSSIKIINIFICEHLRGKGHGKNVINQLITECQGKYKKITLNVLHNNPAKKLYERIGFKFIGQNDQILTYDLNL